MVGESHPEIFFFLLTFENSCSFETEPGISILGHFRVAGKMP
jgi:hypothetical protein